MNPSRKIAVLSAGIILCLLALWGVSLRGGRPRQTRFGPEWTQEETDGVEVERGGAKFSLKRSAEGFWRITAPFSAAADSAAVDAAVDAISSAEPLDTMSFKEIRRMERSMSVFGLSPANVSVTLKSGRRSKKYLFGTTSASGSGVYAGIAGGDGVSIVPASVLSSIPGGAEDVRDRSIARFDVSRVSGIDIRAPGDPFMRIRRSGKSWAVELPSPGPASQESVEYSLAALAGARAASFVGLDGDDQSAAPRQTTLAQFGLADGQGTEVVLRLDDNSTARVVFGGMENGATNSVYALVQDGSAVAIVDAAAARAFSGGENRFRDTRVFPRDFDMASVSFSDGSRTWAISKDPSGLWKMSAPVEAPADGDAVAAVVEALLRMRTEDTVEEGARNSLRVAPVSATPGVEVPPFSIPASAVGGTPALESLRSRTVLAIDVSLVSRVTVVCGGVTNIVESGANVPGWRLLRNGDGQQSAREIEEMEAFSAAIANIEAASVENLYATADDMRRYGLEEPFAEFAIDFSGGLPRRNLMLGARCGGGRYAASSRTGAVFALGAAAVNNLLRPFAGNRPER